MFLHRHRDVEGVDRFHLSDHILVDHQPPKWGMTYADGFEWEAQGEYASVMNDYERIAEEHEGKLSIVRVFRRVMSDDDGAAECIAPIAHGSGAVLIDCTQDEYNMWNLILQDYEVLMRTWAGLFTSAAGQ